MKIENKKTKKNLRSSSKSSSFAVNNQTTALFEQSFQDVLLEQNSALLRERLDLLLEDLDGIGQRMTKTFSFHDLVAYKKMLKGFLGEIMQQAYGIKEETGRTGNGRPKVYQRIELLDQELEELTKIVLEKQKDAVKLLKKLDTIRGILVDFYS